MQQAWESLELLGIETRNKYRILDASMNSIAFAAEQSTGIGGILGRYFFGHWRTFKITIFDQDRVPQYNLEFPFRWFFKTLIVKNAAGVRIGYLQQRFAILRKKFDIHDKFSRKVAYINSTFFRFWTFDVYGSQKIASIQKKWSGALGEIFTGKDNFIVHFYDHTLPAETRVLILAACLMVDIAYFENNEVASGVLDLID